VKLFTKGIQAEGHPAGQSSNSSSWLRGRNPAIKPNAVCFMVLVSLKEELQAKRGKCEGGEGRREGRKERE